MCLAQGQNTARQVRLEPSAPRSRVKHSTTEPLHSLHTQSKKADEDSSHLGLYLYKITAHVCLTCLISTKILCAV